MDTVLHTPPKKLVRVYTISWVAVSGSISPALAPRHAGCLSRCKGGYAGSDIESKEVRALYAKPLLICYAQSCHGLIQEKYTKIIISILITAAALWLTTAVVPGIRIESSLISFLLVAVVFGLVNADDAVLSSTRLRWRQGWKKLGVPLL